jgi:tetratricopeptide (TPR) repeat protein
VDEDRDIEEFLRKFETIEPFGGTERELLKMARQKSYEQIRARTETNRFRLVATAVLFASTVAALYIVITSAAPLGRETELGRLPERLASKPLPTVEEQVKMPALSQAQTRPVEVVEPQKVFLRETGSLAVVVDLIGEVTAAGRALKRGDALGKGALVETGVGSMCAICGRDGSNFKLNTQTVVRFIDLTESRLIEIEKGELWADAAPVTDQSTPLIVKTPNSKATILGTEFSLTVTSQRTLLSVKEGSVSLESSSGKATVGASEQCLVTSQKPPVVRRLVHLANRFGWTALLSSEGQHPVEKSRSAATFVTSEGSVGTLVAKIDNNWQPLTLSRQHITVVIEGGVARTTVEEAFYNNTGSQLEGQFKFPLPKDASICRFAMTVDPEGRKLMEGSIVERTYARQIYESIVARKRDPGLLEWQSGSTFSARIFPVFPRSEKRIVISYTQPVATHAGLSRYTYPMVGSLMTSMPPEDFQLVVMLKTSGKIISLDCPSHNVGVARDSDSCVRVGFAAKKYSARNNFVLLWDEDAGGLDVVQTSGTQGYALLRLRPDLSSFPAEKPERVVLLVDTSASIAPNEREIIYNVVEKILTNLGPDCEFLIGFVDVSTRFASDGFEKATPENIEKALAEVWSADSAGATNLQKCAERLSEALTGDSPATVIYIGDGQPTMGETHLPELTALFRNRLSDRVSRFFAVGVGSDADEMMLRSISSSLRGTHIVLLPGDNLLDKILGLCEEINQPILTDATLTVEGELLQNVYPATIPPIPAGGECIVVAKYNRIGKVSATLKGKVAEREYQKIIQFTTGAGEVSETTLGRIWAQRRIADLLSTNTGGRNKEEIITLSKSFSIVTPYTSLLVLETEEEYKRYSIERKPGAVDAAIKQPTSPDLTIDSSGDIHVYEFPYGTSVTSSVSPPSGYDTPVPLLEEGWTQIPRSISGGIDTPAPVRIPRGTSFDGLSSKNLDSTSGVDAYGIGGERSGAYGARWREVINKMMPEIMGKLERLPKNEALLLLGEEVSGTSRLDILMQNLPREAVVRIFEALIDVREDGSTQTAQNEKLLRLKRKVYEALWPEFGRREDFVRTFAIILSAVGEKEKSIRLLSSNIDISPDDPSKRAEFAASLRQAGYFAEACEQYEEAIRLRPEEASYYVAAAECAEATGESGSKKAEELYTTVLKMNLNENNPLVLTASERLLALYERQLAAFTASGDSKGAANVTEKIRKLKEKKLVCAELRVILRWDTGNTDVDLWVTPSEDQKCSYQQMRTLRGGKLDKDVTSGYGPETFTMSQLRPGKYLIQVNYFSGGPKTSGTVEVITHEGTEKEKKTACTFTLREKGEVVTIFDGGLE